MEGDSPVLQAIGFWAYKMYEEREVLKMELHLLLSALFPIYIGSHASLRRPPSAARPDKKSRTGESKEDEDEDFNLSSTVEGLRPSDAILIPIVASLTLGGLYFLIKWLEDPAILNRILGYYFSILGVVGVGKLAGDALNVLTTFIFPSVWSTKLETYYIDPLLSAQLTGSSSESGKYPLHRKFVEDKTTPLPGLLSRLKFSNSMTKALWTLRAILSDNWIFRGYIHGIMSIKTKLRLNDVTGLLLGFAVILAYNLYRRAWFLTNLMGFGFCYGTLQLMSPTTFWTGSLILGGLFIYDITMVFYTPLMVTVATKLDVPIKLVIPGPQRDGMLGLGDIVLPGIMIALALRFDLYLHYLRKQPSQLKSLQASKQPNDLIPKPTLHTAKPSYIEATGHWGERFWTSSAPNSSSIPSTIRGGHFKKTYFYASIIGYIIGMSLTVIVLNVFNHAQPALLYLVPGVLGALWGTAAVRGEVGEMWRYTEDGSLDDGSDNDDNDKKVGEAKGSSNGTVKDGDKAKDKKEKEKKEKKARELFRDKEQPVFYFILTSPRKTLENVSSSEDTLEERGKLTAQEGFRVN